MMGSLLFFLFLFSSIITAQVIPPTNPNIYFTGRTEQASDGSIVYDWPGVQFEFYFSNSPTVNLILKELMPQEFSSEASGSWLNIILDGNLVNIITLTSDNDTYEVINGISDSNLHHLLITKRTEPLVGVVSFGGVILAKGGALQPPPSSPLPSRKLEFIGDSITCGYGNQGLAGCHFTPPTQNNLYTYEHIIGGQFNAQVFVEAWSGKGVIRNCCNQNVTTPNPLPSYYGFSVANYPTSKWTFSQWVPDAIIINLGTNDYSTPPQPSSDLFIPAYVNFISTIRESYAPANPAIFVACGPMIGDPCCQYVQTVASKANATYIAMAGILTYPYDYGCDGHPSVSGHYKMAEAAIPIIQKSMNW